MLRISVPLLLATLLAACGTQTGQVTISTRPSDATALMIRTPTTPTTGASLKRVRILITEAELRGGHGMGMGMPFGGCGHGGHQEQGPIIAELSADAVAAGKVTDPILLANVKPGTYRGTELEIGTLGSEEKHHRGGMDSPAALGPAFDDFKRLGASTIIDGTWAGEDFQFATAFEAEQESAVKVTVGSGKTIALALVVDGTGWFKGADGSDLDPRDPANQAAITANIQKSLTIEDEKDHHR
jgi:hypothetical protein